MARRGKSKNVWLSYSGASTFKACPEKFYLQKQWKSKGNFSYFVFGSAVEAGITEALTSRNKEKMLEAFEAAWRTENAGSTSKDEYKREKPIFDNLTIEYSGTDIDLDLVEAEHIRLDQWVTELFNDPELTFKPVMFSIFKKIKDGEALSSAEDKFYKRVGWMSLKVKGTYMLNSFFDRTLKEIKRIVEINGKPASQMKIEIGSDEGDKIIGYVDYVVEMADGRIVILDCKTAASAYDGHTLLTSEQLKTYASALSHELDEMPEIGYLVLVKKLITEKSCTSCGALRENSKLKNCVSCGEGKYESASYSAEIQLLTRKITEDEMDAQLEDYSHIADAIRNEVRYKNPSNCMSFGRRCEFYDFCHKGKALEKLTTIEKKEYK